MPRPARRPWSIKLPPGGSRRLKLYVELAASTHVDRGHGPANAGTAGLGAQVSW